MKNYLKKAGGITFTVVVVGVIIVGLVAYNNWAYNEWTCVFKHCVQVKK